jgi:hypothetical protein
VILRQTYTRRTSNLNGDRSQIHVPVVLFPATLSEIPIPDAGQRRNSLLEQIIECILSIPYMQLNSIMASIFIKQKLLEANVFRILLPQILFILNHQIIINRLYDSKLINLSQLWPFILLYAANYFLMKQTNVG